MRPFFKNVKCFSIAGLFIAVIAGGCENGADLRRAVVTGEVSYQGQAVDDGLIRFVPIDGTKGPPAGATITTGRYEVKAGGGVPIGKCRVEIRGFRLGTHPTAKPAPPLAAERKQQYIPKIYNRNSTLEVEIDTDAKQEMDFELK